MAQINMPRAQEKQSDPLDIVLRGLQIAQGVYGIKSENARNTLLASQAEKQGALTDAQLADLERKNKGIVTQSEILAQGGKYIPGKQGEQGALPFQVQGANGIETVYLKPPKSEEASGLAGLIKGQQAVLQGLQIQEHQKKAGEIEGPKATAATFGRRMEQANNVMADLEAKGYDRSNPISAAESNLPGFAKGLQSPYAKQQAQAERNFVNAVLRRESGAAISPQEFASAEEQYFTRSGDDPETRAQKAQNRAQAIAGLRAEAGHAWQKIPLEQVPIPSGAKGALMSVGAIGSGQQSGAGGITPEEAQQELIRRQGMKARIPK